MDTPKVLPEVELWKGIAGYEGRYMISSFGRVKSLPKGTRNRSIILKVFDVNGYAVVKLIKDGAYTHFLVHRLVATYYVANPDNKPEVNHDDGNKRNNHYLNLFWVTGLENREHAQRTGLLKALKGIECPYTKLTELNVKVIRAYLSQGMTHIAIAKEFNVKRTTITAIHSGRSWSHLK